MPNRSLAAGFDTEEFLLRLPGRNAAEGLRENGIVASPFRK